MGMDAQRRQLIRVIRTLHSRGWCDGTGGNFSLVCNRNPLNLLMAPSGVDKGSVEADDLIEVNASGTVILGQGKASAETLMHLQIINQCAAGAVLHTHSHNGTLLSRLHQRADHLKLEGWEMLKGLAGIETHDTSVELPILNNDQNLELLSEQASHRLGEAPSGLLVAGHGLYAWGNDLFEAQRHTEIIEFLLELTWREMLLRRTL